jgi:hypothetical protein
VLDDAVDDHDERPRGSADLHPGSAQSRDQESGDDCGVEPALGRHSARDREGNRQRERDDPDDDARAQIGKELRAIVAPQGREQFGNEHLCSRDDRLVQQDAGQCAAGHEPRGIYSGQTRASVSRVIVQASGVVSAP